MTSLDEPRWRTRLLCGMGLPALASVFVAVWSLERADGMTARSTTTSLTMENRIEKLESQLRFAEDRSRTARAFAETIRKVRPHIDAGKARDYARAAIRATDEYPDVDPFLLLAVGFVESHYDEKAVSHSGARGLYQILPSTGRSLAKEMGVDFDEAVLFDPDANTEMATRYLSALVENHDDLQLALAEYNGGPRNAAHFAAGSTRLAAETRVYVDKVLQSYRMFLSDGWSSRVRSMLRSKEPPVTGSRRKTSAGIPSTAATSQ